MLQTRVRKRGIKDAQAGKAPSEIPSDRQIRVHQCQEIIIARDDAPCFRLDGKINIFAVLGIPFQNVSLRDVFNEA